MGRHRALGTPAFRKYSFIRDLLRYFWICSRSGPVVMWKSVRRAASTSSQYSLLLSTQSSLPYRKVK